MKQKGQISLDLMLTIIAAILLGSVFTTYTSQLIESERTTGIKAQEENIANDLLELINQSKMFDEAGETQFTIRYKIPYLLDPDKRGGQDCSLMLKRDTKPYILVTYRTVDLDQVAVKKDLNFNFLNASDVNYVCGQTIDLTRTIIGEKRT